MTEETRRPGVIAQVALWLIAAYRRVLSPLLGANCRYTPSCSAYAEEAFQRHGAGRAAVLSVKRIGRCHPFREGGYDPVPASTTTSPPVSSGPNS